MEKNGGSKGLRSGFVSEQKAKSRSGFASKTKNDFTLEGSLEEG